jgi:D-alanyl-D-alanine carboxypeptidase (penicillin-binding protein 5/6)
LTAQSAIVVDFATGDILFQKNQLDRHQPASITKLLTATVVDDEYDWGVNTYLTMSQTAFDIYGGNSLQVGEKFTTEDIVKAALMVSSNDSAELLAESFGGVENFVAKMNKKAQDLKMDQSKFFNAHGLDEEPVSNYTTAADLIKLIQYMYDNDTELIDVLAQKETFIKSQSGQSIRVGNTNELLGVMPEMLAAKTGLTDEAGETLASVVSIQNRILGIVVLQSGIGGYRFQDTKNLIKWVQDNYSI